MYEKAVSPAAVTYTKKADKKADKTAGRDAWLLDRPFQVVLGLHRARSQILEYFDLAPTKVLARIDPAASLLSPTLLVEALPTFHLAMQHHSFFVDTLYWSPASVARVTKYVAKGFECAVPGVRRAAFIKALTPEADHFYSSEREAYAWSKGEGPTKSKITVTHGPESYRYLRGVQVKGLGVLFVAESEVLVARKYLEDGHKEFEYVETIEGRLAPSEAAVIASKVAGTLGSGQDPPAAPKPCRRGWDESHILSAEDDDDDDHSEYEYDGGLFDMYSRKWGTGTYGFIREAFRRDVAVRIGDARRGIGMHKVFWTFSEAGRFKPEEAHLEAMYEPEALARAAHDELERRAAHAATMTSDSDSEDEESEKDDGDVGGGDGEGESKDVGRSIETVAKVKNGNSSDKAIDLADE